MTAIGAAAIDWTGQGAADHGTTMAQRGFSSPAEGRYVLTIGDSGVTLDVDRLRRRFDELVGELVVSCRLPGARTVGETDVISAGDFNLSSIRARKERADLLRARSQADDVDWFGLLEELAGRVLAAERTGQPAQHLRDLDPPGADQIVELDGLPILRHHPMILFGDGGSAKSILALYYAGRLTQKGIRTLYADWEFSGADHRERLARLFGADMMPDVLYARCDKSFPDEVDRLTRIIRDEHVEYLVCDSIGFACGGAPESAEIAGAYFRALRRLKIGSLHIAHVNRSEHADQKPFGSTFWHNGARATWNVQRGDEAPDGSRFTVGLFNRKTNVKALRPAFGFDLTFEADGMILLRKAALAARGDFAGKLPVWQRMMHLLKSGPLPIPAIAAALDAKPETVERAVRRGKDSTFLRLVGADGVSKIALVERRA